MLCFSSITYNGSENQNYQTLLSLLVTLMWHYYPIVFISKKDSCPIIKWNLFFMMGTKKTFNSSIKSINNLYPKTFWIPHFEILKILSLLCLPILNYYVVILHNPNQVPHGKTYLRPNIKFSIKSDSHPDTTKFIKIVFSVT